MAENTVDKAEIQSAREFLDKCALLAIKEILRSREYHPYEDDKIVDAAFEIALSAVMKRDNLRASILSMNKEVAVWPKATT